jgi:hypothetical protein
MVNHSGQDSKLTHARCGRQEACWWLVGDLSFVSTVSVLALITNPSDSLKHYSLIMTKNHAVGRSAVKLAHLSTSHNEDVRSRARNAIEAESLSVDAY